LGNRPTFVHTSAIADEKTFFLDGAGNFGFGKETVPLGLADAGYHGQVEHFIWTTYWGPIYDQMSITHNRRKAAELARQIEAHLDLHPSGKVNIIALSAGSGVAVFALEVLGSDYRVDNVVLLSSSLSAEYDLTRALKHVRGGMYFFWSPDDPILKRLVPIVGSVDQEGSTPLAAGVAGASPPVRASRETMQLYRQRVHNVKWEPEILVGPVKYWHAGSITRSMIRELVAPIIVGKAPETPRPIPSPQIRRAGGSKPTTPRPTVSTPTGSQGPEVTGPPLPYAEHWVR
jgi:pimeloyl-ACP methyl ester carboxylesterase